MSFPIIFKFNSSNSISLTLSKLEEEKLSNNFWNISWKLGEFLSELVRQKNPQNILEIGTSNGFSTIWIAKAISKSTLITTIEVDEMRFNLAKKNFESAKIQKNIRQIKGEVFDILNSKILDKKFDFIFMDAAHKYYKEVIQALFKKNLIDKNCVIVCDNIISHKYMAVFIDWMKKRFKVRIHKIDSGFLIANSF